MRLKTYSWALLFAFVCIVLLGTVFAYRFSYAVNVGSEYDLKRFLVIGFVLFFSLILCAVKEVELIRLSRVTQACLASFFTLAVCSALASKHPFWGMVEIANMGLLIAVFCLFSISMRSMVRETLHFFVYSFVLLFSVLTLAKYILFLFFSYLDAQSFGIHSLVSGYVNVRFFNQLQSMVVPLLLLPFFSPGLIKFKRISIAVISLHWAVLLQTEARGCMLSLILVLSVMLFFVGADIRKRFIVTMLQTILIGVCLWLVFILALPYWLIGELSFQIRTGSSGRMDLWLYVLTSIPERWWLGWGPMSFVWGEGKPSPYAHPHNAVMQLVYEYGVIATTVFISWVLSRVYLSLNYVKREQNNSFVPVTYALLSGLCYSLFSGVVVMPFAQLMLVFVMALLAQIDETGFYQVGRCARVVMFLAVTIATLVLLSTYKHVELHGALFPRIWENGLIGY